MIELWNNYWGFCEEKLNLALEYSSMQNGVWDYFLSLWNFAIMLLVGAFGVFVIIFLITLLLIWPVFVGLIIEDVYRSRLLKKQNMYEISCNFNNQDFANIIALREINKMDSEDLDIYCQRAYDILCDLEKEYFPGQKELVNVLESYVTLSQKERKNVKKEISHKVLLCCTEYQLVEWAENTRYEINQIEEQSRCVSGKWMVILYCIYIFLSLPFIVHMFS